MFLFWRKNNSKIDAVALTTAKELFSFVSPEQAARYFAGKKEKKKKIQRNVENRFREVIKKLNTFSQENSLGIYGKARLNKQFSDRLLELGYDEKITRQLVQEILYGQIA